MSTVRQRIARAVTRRLRMGAFAAIVAASIAPSVASAVPHADDFDTGRARSAPSGVVDTGSVVVTSGARVAPGPRSTAVILMNFGATPQTPWTMDQIRTAVFTGPASVNAYHREQSFGAISLSGKVNAEGDVFGWYTLPTADTSVCAPSTWAQEARLQAQSAGVNLTGYAHYVYLFSHVPACGWAGLASVGGSYSYINGTLSVRVIAHELGHNLGSHHASALTCLDGAGQRVAYSANCTISEYGDPFDVMGSSDRQGVALRKVGHGWLPFGAEQSVSVTGTYALNTSSVFGSGVRSLRIPRGTAGGSWYVELRSPAGVFDDFGLLDPAVTGVGIRRADYIGSRTMLVDTQPATATFADAPLRVSETFTDPETGIAVRLASVALGVASVEVTIPGTTPVAPPSAPEDPTPVAPPPADTTPGTGTPGATAVPRPSAVVLLTRHSARRGTVRVTFPVSTARSCEVRVGSASWTACRIVGGRVTAARRAGIGRSPVRVAVRLDGRLALVTSVGPPRVGATVRKLVELRSGA